MDDEVRGRGRCLQVVSGGMKEMKYIKYYKHSAYIRAANIIYLDWEFVFLDYPRCRRNYKEIFIRNHIM